MAVRYTSQQRPSLLIRFDLKTVFIIQKEHTTTLSVVTVYRDHFWMHQGRSLFTGFSSLFLLPEWKKLGLSKDISDVWMVDAFWILNVARSHLWVVQLTGTICVGFSQWHGASFITQRVTVFPSSWRLRISCLSHMLHYCQSDPCFPINSSFSSRNTTRCHFLIECSESTFAATFNFVLEIKEVPIPHGPNVRDSHLSRGRRDGTRIPVTAA